MTESRYAILVLSRSCGPSPWHGDGWPTLTVRMRASSPASTAMAMPPTIIASSLGALRAGFGGLAALPGACRGRRASPGTSGTSSRPMRARRRPTDGRFVVTWLGSQGVFAYDLSGAPLWSVDLGRVDMGAYDIPTYEWARPAR